MQYKGKPFLAISAISMQVYFANPRFFQAIVLALWEQLLCFVPIFHVHIAELGNKNFTSLAHMWFPF